MLEILSNDTHYFGITAICTVALNLLAFAISYICQFDKLTDFIGSLSFIMCALISFLSAQLYTQRQIAVTILLIVSRIELASYLLYRVLKRGRDERFDVIRGNFFAFLGFWIGQIVWAWGVSMPVLFVNGDGADPPFGSSRDIAGIVLFCIAFLTEVIADFQKDAFRSNPANKGKVCDAGVWYYSRHPNFLGEITMWWAIFIIAAPVLDASSSSWGYVVILSPILTFTILMFGSGMPTAEGDNQKRFMKTHKQKELFMQYREQTSPLIPFPTSLYRGLPKIVKQICFFELPMYETDWTYCGENETNHKASGMLAASAQIYNGSHENAAVSDTTIVIGTVVNNPVSTHAV